MDKFLSNMSQFFLAMRREIRSTIRHGLRPAEAGVAGRGGAEPARKVLRYPPWHREFAATAVIPVHKRPPGTHLGRGIIEALGDTGAPHSLSARWAPRVVGVAPKPSPSRCLARGSERLAYESELRATAPARRVRCEPPRGR